jgi:hypothetical protein
VAAVLTLGTFGFGGAPFGATPFGVGAGGHAEAGMIAAVALIAPSSVSVMLRAGASLPVGLRAPRVGVIDFVAPLGSAADLTGAHRPAVDLVN